MKFSHGKIEFDQYEIRFLIDTSDDSDGSWITLSDKETDGFWSMDYEDPQVIMPTITMLMYSETMREEFKNA